MTRISRKPYDPNYWKDAKPSTSTEPWSEYWKAGYQIAKLTPVCVDEYCRSESEAIRKSAEAAAKAQRDLDKVYFEDNAVPWIQHWRVHSVRKEEVKERIMGDPKPRRTYEKKDGYIKDDRPIGP